MIAKSWLSGCWQWKIGASVALAGTLGVGISGIAIAKVVPDNTLGAESSVVTPNVNIEGIQGDRSLSEQALRLDGGLRSSLLQA